MSNTRDCCGDHWNPSESASQSYNPLEYPPQYCRENSCAYKAILQKISADILSLSDKLGGGVAFYKQMRKYAEDLAEKSNVVSMAIYDCFEGEVKILEETEEKVYIEVIDVLPCYSCQKTPECGERFWIEKSLIYHPVYNTSPSSGDDVPY